MRPGENLPASTDRGVSRRPPPELRDARDLPRALRMLLPKKTSRTPHNDAMLTLGIDAHALAWSGWAVREHVWGQNFGVYGAGAALGEGIRVLASCLERCLCLCMKLCLCLRLCMSLFLCLYTGVCVSVCCVCVGTCMHACVRACVCVRLFTRIYLGICGPTLANVCVGVWVGGEWVGMG